jgi:hypothetical protein
MTNGENVGVRKRARHVKSLNGAMGGMAAWVANAQRGLVAAALLLFGVTTWGKIVPASSMEDVQHFAQLDASAQGAWMLARTKSGALTTMDDAQLLALFHAMSPEGFIAYFQAGIDPLRSYQFEMIRRERHDGTWPGKADHMLVRYEQTPRRVYARWLPDGAHAGQSISYDESQDATHLTAHPGGLPSFVRGTFPLDGAIAHLQSMHSVRDLGLQFTLRALEHDFRSDQMEGASARPARIELTYHGNERRVALTWLASQGPPAHYANEVRMELDLQHPWPRDESAWDSGVLTESVEFEHVALHNWPDGTMAFGP